jgi:hypothetical protein
MPSGASLSPVVDRVGLLEALVTRARLPAAQAAQLNRQLDRALALAVGELALKDARALPTAARAELEGALRELLTAADLRRLAGGWEPRRRIDADASQTEITDSLAELLRGAREPYEPCTRTLGEARALPETQRAQLRASIARWAPAADLRRLAAKWDRHNRPLAQGARALLAAALVALLDGRCEPLAGRPPPAPAPLTHRS